MHIIRKHKLIFASTLLFCGFIFYYSTLKSIPKPIPACAVQTRNTWRRINGTFININEVPVSTTNLRLESLDSFVTNQTIRNFARPVANFHSVKSVERLRSPDQERSKVTEQFTIVMLTFNRTDVLMKLLQHLCGLPHLNQLLLIWNNPEPPPHDLQWPTVNYNIRLLSNGKNTMHNRFLPLSIVKTEAIFILDDDLFVVHEKVLEAFRIWQDNRDRIVGFHGRGVKFVPNPIGGSTAGKWVYDSSPPLDSISLVLAGSAFIHRNFLELYTYEMPEKMRRIIDLKMNCDDLALNFLVSERTQKSPIFVQHAQNFLCAGCTDTGLWTDPSHFTERDECLNEFAEILGYMPLFKP